MEIEIVGKHSKSSRGAYMGAVEGANELTFGISPTAGATPVEILRIDADGKVGINTNGPQGTLQINDGLNGLEFNVNSNNAVVAYNRNNFILSSSWSSRFKCTTSHWRNWNYT